MGKMFMSGPLQTQVIEWVHTMPATGHPGVQKTAKALVCKYHLKGDIANAIRSCSLCTITKLCIHCRPGNEYPFLFCRDCGLCHRYPGIQRVHHHLGGSGPVFEGSLLAIQFPAHSPTGSQSPAPVSVLHYGMLEDILSDPGPHIVSRV